MCASGALPMLQIRRTTGDRRALQGRRPGSQSTSRPARSASRIRARQLDVARAQVVGCVFPTPLPTPGRVPSGAVLRVPHAHRADPTRLETIHGQKSGGTATHGRGAARDRRRFRELLLRPQPLRAVLDSVRSASPEMPTTHLRSPPGDIPEHWRSRRSSLTVYSLQSRNRSLRLCSPVGRRETALRVLVSVPRIPPRVLDLSEAGHGTRAALAAPRCRSERRTGDGHARLPEPQTPLYPLQRRGFLMDVANRDESLDRGLQVLGLDHDDQVDHRLRRQARHSG